MKIIDSPISLEKLWQGCESGLTGMIKIVLDIENKILAADAEIHSGNCGAFGKSWVGCISPKRRMPA